MFWALARLLHFVAWATSFGASLSAFHLHRGTRIQPAPEKGPIERAAADLITKRELVALFVALFAGILLISQNPTVLNPATSGAGPWLHIKLTIVLGLLVVAHLRMFRARRLSKARAEGENEAQLGTRLKSVQKLAILDLVLHLAVMFVATFRFVLFGGR